VVRCSRVDNRSLRWQHAVKPDICSKSQFLPTAPAFDAPVRGFPSEYCHAVWHGKNRTAWLPTVKKFWRHVYSFWQNSRTWRTDVQTPHDGRPRLYIASRGKNPPKVGQLWRYTYSTVFIHFRLFVSYADIEWSWTYVQLLLLLLSSANDLVLSFC